MLGAVDAGGNLAVETVPNSRPDLQGIVYLVIGVRVGLGDKPFILLQNSPEEICGRKIDARIERQRRFLRCSGLDGKHEGNRHNGD